MFENLIPDQTYVENIPRNLQFIFIQMNHMLRVYRHPKFIIK